MYGGDQPHIVGTGDIGNKEHGRCIEIPVCVEFTPEVPPFQLPQLAMMAVAAQGEQPAGPSSLE